jgi:hypothetical protein
VKSDEAEPFGVGGEYTLTLRSSALPAQCSCASALPLMDGASLPFEQLDLAGDKSPEVNPAELVFDPTSWSTPQTVTVVG